MFKLLRTIETELSSIALYVEIKQTAVRKEGMERSQHFN